MSVFPGNPEPGLTDAELRASPVPVSGTVTANTGGLTNNELRSSPVQVTGTVTANTGGLTDAQLRETPVQVSVSGRVTVDPAYFASVTTFSSTSSSQILGSNTSRKSVTIFNSTPNVLYLLLGSGTASSSNYSFALGEKELLSLSGITTAVQGIYATSGTAYITELT